MIIPKPRPGTKPSFRRIWIRDKNKLSGQDKKREICPPNKTMLALHNQFLEELKKLGINMPNATGCLAGCSALNNVMMHMKSAFTSEFGFNRYVCAYDAKAAYRQVTLERMVDALSRHDRLLNRKDARHFLKKYCIDPLRGGLYTGAPSSPYLFNIYCETWIDEKMREALRPFGINYTRYLDDFTFSSPHPIGKRKRKAILAVITEAGFIISHRKSQVLDLKKGPVQLNGIGIRMEGTTFMPRRELVKLNGLLHMALKDNSDIKQEVVEGRMGVFFATTRTRKFNATEKRIVEKYKRYRKKVNSPFFDAIKKKKRRKQKAHPELNLSPASNEKTVIANDVA
jgi:hypothetical protein